MFTEHVTPNAPSQISFENNQNRAGSGCSLGGVDVSILNEITISLMPDDTRQMHLGSSFARR